MDAARSGTGDDNASGANRFPGDVVLVVGQFAGPPPSRPDVRFTWDFEEPCGLVAMLPGGDADAAFERLAISGRLAVPVADLTGGGSPRADFSGYFLSETTLNDALSATNRIRQALNSLPPISGSADRERLLALTLAFSRGCPIEAKWAPNTPELVGYPLLTGLQNCQSMLEQFAQSGLLTRRFFDRVNICGGCRSARLAAREVCTGCGSAHLKEDTLIHHYRCAEQAPRSHFQDGQAMVCPKCNRVLRHYGVDYDAPGLIQICRECNEINQEADVAFVCADCGCTTSGEDVKTQDWYHYSLTPEGELSVLEGRLPSLGLESFASGMTGHRAPHDLAMMIDFATRVHKRYERPFAVILIKFSFSDEPHALDQLRAETLLWDIIRGMLRDTDFIAALEHQLVLLLPETSADSASAVVQRVNERLEEATKLSTQIRAEVIAEDRLAGLMDILLSE